MSAGAKQTKPGKEGEMKGRAIKRGSLWEPDVRGVLTILLRQDLTDPATRFRSVRAQFQRDVLRVIRMRGWYASHQRGGLRQAGRSFEGFIAFLGEVWERRFFEITDILHQVVDGTVADTVASSQGATDQLGSNRGRFRDAMFQNFLTNDGSLFATSGGWGETSSKTGVV
jgi:hypothetical protein